MQLSIYDIPSKPIVLAPEQPSQLQMQVSSVRKTTEVLYKDARRRLREASNGVVGMERRVERESPSVESGQAGRQAIAWLRVREGQAVAWLCLE